ncbi:hypothetical protein L3Q67_45210 (plasmid) [Saccharothrix sp. AJ9571]|nr:hypothetical protein L3Q67_45210 [Saccharothrix sp. AJ9571]
MSHSCEPARDQLSLANAAAFNYYLLTTVSAPLTGLQHLIAAGLATQVADSLEAAADGDPDAAAAVKASAQHARAEADRHLHSAWRSHAFQHEVDAVLAERRR